jgi:hypothetical protein
MIYMILFFFYFLGFQEKLMLIPMIEHTFTITFIIIYRYRIYPDLLLGLIFQRWFIPNISKVLTCI